MNLFLIDLEEDHDAEGGTFHILYLVDMDTGQKHELKTYLIGEM